MSSKNLFGENVIFGSYSVRVRKNAKKIEKINIQRLSNFVSKTIKILFGEERKRADRRQSFAFASLIYRAVEKSERKCPEVSGVNVNDPLDPGSEPYVSRASLQDDVR